jgi:molybdopterin-binding protein
VRNQISGTIAAITRGAVDSTVEVAIGGGIIVMSSITKNSIVDHALPSVMQ